MPKTPQPDTLIAKTEVPIDRAWKANAAERIITNLMHFMQRKHEEVVNSLIDDNCVLMHSYNPAVRIRDKLFSHTNRYAPSPRGVRDPIPALHLDLFDRGQQVYIASSKLQWERDRMIRMISLMTDNAGTVQEFRDGLLPVLDPYAKPISEYPRVQTDPFFKVSSELIKNQLEELKGIFAVYAMAEIMGQ